MRNILAKAAAATMFLISCPAFGAVVQFQDADELALEHLATILKNDDPQGEELEKVLRADEALESASGLGPRFLMGAIDMLLDGDLRSVSKWLDLLPKLIAANRFTSEEIRDQVRIKLESIREVPVNARLAVFLQPILQVYRKLKLWTVEDVDFFGFVFFNGYGHTVVPDVLKIDLNKLSEEQKTSLALDMSVYRDPSSLALLSRFQKLRPSQEVAMLGDLAINYSNREMLERIHFPSHFDHYDLDIGPQLNVELTLLYRDVLNEISTRLKNDDPETKTMVAQARSFALAQSGRKWTIIDEFLSG